MLGTYVTQAFTRWWYSVSTFEKFLTAIRQMVFMLHTINSQERWRLMIEKYCIASGYLLDTEVRLIDKKNKKNQKDHEDHLLDWLVDNDLLSEEEMSMLKTKRGGNTVCSMTRAVWSWIGELISHPCVEEGVVVLPPLLVRTITLCQDCVNEIELLKMNITMQMPFMYAQLLAILVHANNILLSLSCGAAVGSALNEIRHRHDQLSGAKDTHHSMMTITKELYEAIQTCIVQVLMVLVAPTLYVAFLHIAHMLCYPFGDKSYHLPTEALIATMHSNLNQMSENRNYFRGKHAEFSAMERTPRKQKKDDEEEDDDCDGGD
jgi:hypothetical protein